jgi:hypothetical protein
MEKEIELYGMTLAELDTEVEIAKSAEVDEYVKTIKWSDDTDEYTKLLIVGNIRGFAFRKTTPETPINGFINKLAQRFAELTAREARLTGALDGWVGYHKALRGGQIVGCPGNGYGGSCTDSGGYPDGLDNANPSQICDFHKLLRSTHKALAEAQRIQEGK